MDYKQFKLISSNEKKLIEFKRFGLSQLKIEKGIDLSEVDGNALEVIIYKSIEAGKGTIVEDTSLNFRNKDIKVGVNIRWLLDDLDKYVGEEVVWEVMLGVNDGENINIFSGEIQGTITNKSTIKSDFGFDSVFLPVKSNFTLAELENKNQKDLFSARKLAVSSLLSNNYIFEKKIKDIPIWNGEMQKSEKVKKKP